MQVHGARPRVVRDGQPGLGIGIAGESGLDLSDDQARYSGESLDEGDRGITVGDLLAEKLFRVGRHHPAEDHDVDRGHVEHVHHVGEVVACPRGVAPEAQDSTVSDKTFSLRPMISTRYSGQAQGRLRLAA